MTTVAVEPVKKSRRGFASLSVERRREVARNGGRKAHALGRAHKWTSEEAVIAGRIGGSRSKRRKKLPEE